MITFGKAVVIAIVIIVIVVYIAVVPLLLLHHHVNIPYDCFLVYYFFVAFYCRFLSLVNAQLD